MDNSKVCSIQEYEKQKKAYCSFVETGTIENKLLRSEISCSWARCFNKTSEIYKPKICSAMLLKDKQFFFKDVISITRPLAEKLCRLLGENALIVLSDKEGIILELFGCKNIIQSAQELDVSIGRQWTEDAVGTNAIGISLETEKEVQVCAYEHLWVKAHRWTCSSAPIFDENEQLMGTLSLFSIFKPEATHAHTLGMVLSYAEAITNSYKASKTMYCLNKKSQFQRAIMESIEEGIIATDEQGMIVEINKKALQLINYKVDICNKKRVYDIIPETESMLQKVLKKQERQEEEISVNSGNKKIQCFFNAYPIFEGKKISGTLFNLREIKHLKKTWNKMAGDRARFTFESIVATNPKVIKVLEIAKKAAQCNSTIMLLGESGTGKEVFAQAIHNASLQAGGPFIAVNCSAIPRELIGSELFGYKEGAYTGAKKGGNPGKFELADGGTIFLDEIAEMPLNMQTMLLRPLNDKTVVRIGGQTAIPVNTRVIAATNKDLQQELKNGSFREDLFYRLNVITIEIPPLRERPEDIPNLVYHFSRQFCPINVGFKGINNKALNILQGYHWPGNIRELENIVERAWALACGEILTQDCLPNYLVQNSVPEISSDNGLPYNISSMEVSFIKELLSKHGGNISKIADEMGVARSTIYRKIKKHNIVI